MCEQCNILEDCKHFLFDCRSVKHFWATVVQALKKTYNIELDIRWKHVVYGYFLELPKLEALNMIIMVGTFSAYKARILKQENVTRLMIEELYYINYIKKNNIISDFMNYL